MDLCVEGWRVHKAENNCGSWPPLQFFIKSELKNKSKQNKTTMENTNGLKVQPYLLGELCKIYGVSDKTLKKWIHPHESRIGKRCGKYYNARQVETIFEIFGTPYAISYETFTSAETFINNHHRHNVHDRVHVKFPGMN